jgi:tetratricopeptide (TPR) repeat protein
MRLSLMTLVPLAIFAGCTTAPGPAVTGPSDPTEVPLARVASTDGMDATPAGTVQAVVADDSPGAVRPTRPVARPGAVDSFKEADETGFVAASPVVTHRARRFYLQGVKLLYDPPRVEEAIREFQLALEMDTQFYKAHFKLGICYYHKGQYDLEITEYKKCLAVNRSYAPAWLNLGHAFLARDELESARDAYKEVLGLNPKNRVALYNLGLVEFDLRLFTEARKHLQRFLELDGTGEMGEKARQYLEEIEIREQMEGEEK